MDDHAFWFEIRRGLAMIATDPTVKASPALRRGLAMVLAAIEKRYDVPEERTERLTATGRR